MRPDYYSLLEVSPQASIAEIKKAYRRKVKSVHPDLNPRITQAEHKMNELFTAYETLINPRLREEYDKVFQRYYGVKPFDYRTFLMEEGGAENLSKLIFFELLHGFENDAVKRYQELRSEPDYRLEEHFDREDYMDCAYILAEELENRGYNREALDLFLSIVELEKQKAYFKFFFEEVLIHIKSNVSALLLLEMDVLKKVVLLEKMIHLHISNKETAWFMRNLAEIHIKRNQKEKALFYLEESLRYDAKLSGLKDLKKKLQLMQSGG